jgi:hypothetical protein
MMELLTSFFLLAIFIISPAIASNVEAQWFVTNFSSGLRSSSVTDFSFTVMAVPMMTTSAVSSTSAKTPPQVATIPRSRSIPATSSTSTTCLRKTQKPFNAPTLPHLSLKPSSTSEYALHKSIRLSFLSAKGVISKGKSYYVNNIGFNVCIAIGFAASSYHVGLVDPDDRNNGAEGYGCDEKVDPGCKQRAAAKAAKGERRTRVRQIAARKLGESINEY